MRSQKRTVRSELNGGALLLLALALGWIGFLPQAEAALKTVRATVEVVERNKDGQKVSRLSVYLSDGKGSSQLQAIEGNAVHEIVLGKTKASGAVIGLNIAYKRTDYLRAKGGDKAIVTAAVKVTRRLRVGERTVLAEVERPDGTGLRISIALR